MNKRRRFKAKAKRKIKRTMSRIRSRAYDPDWLRANKLERYVRY